MIHYLLVHLALLSTEVQVIPIDGLPRSVCGRFVIYPLREKDDLESLSNISLEIAPRKFDSECGEFFGEVLRRDAFRLAYFIEEVRNAMSGRVQVISESKDLERCFERSDGYRIDGYEFEDSGRQRLIVKAHCGELQLIKDPMMPLVVTETIHVSDLNLPD
jgi:hypothetical protein